eukprot:CAMPEP_0169173416 /NCGR_PEP_ID=MMETSP1015-20121227/63901_1 /TAXON_ID=342587 /ORGANISM="Karlodinium micrum, Strain CCMP2283" /LENGTH=42 /DNA_ID= /DNA_START= /DNA_END= /DNA_ORIENTATION=
MVFPSKDRANNRASLATSKVAGASLLKSLEDDSGWKPSPALP